MGCAYTLRFCDRGNVQLRSFFPMLHDRTRFEVPRLIRPTKRLRHRPMIEVEQAQYLILRHPLRVIVRDDPLEPGAVGNWTEHMTERRR